MSKSLSDLRNSPDVGRPEKSVSICVAGRLTKELEAIDSDLFDVEAKIERLRDQQRQDRADREDGMGRPGRLGQRSELPDLEAQADELAAKSDAVRARMEENSITLLLRGKPNGEWRQWADTHPARDEDDDKAGFQRDQRWAASLCNIDALIGTLGDYVVKYGDEEPSNGAWEFVAENAAPADLTRLASIVVGMHEQVVDLGKSRVAWRSDRKTASDSE